MTLCQMACGMWGKRGSAVDWNEPFESAIATWSPKTTTAVSLNTQQQNIMPPPALHLIVPGTAEAVRRALQDIHASGILATLSAAVTSSAEIVLAEVLNNIVEHAYAKCAGDIRIAISCDKSGLACCLTDWGAAMPGLALPKGDLQPLGQTAALPEGGFGWFLIRSLATDLTYHRLGNENRLSFLLQDEQS